MLTLIEQSDINAVVDMLTANAKPMSFNVVTFFSFVVGGLGIFLFGMKMLSESLQAVAGELIRKVLGWLTSNRFMAVTVGLLVTMIIQSSSVTTVMVVGFVNAGLMTLRQSIGVILGANIGTTITGWIFALQIGKYGITLIAAGLVPFFFIKKATPKNIGKIMIALGFIFLGLVTMSDGFGPLKELPEFTRALHYFQADNIFSVLACIGIGCVLTFLVQSSSAMLAITIGLAMTGTIEFPTACALVLGENIGTTVTALLASIGGNVHARRAAFAHTSVNVLGVSVMIVIFQPYIVFVEWLVSGSGDALEQLFHLKGDQQKSDAAMMIAAAHSIFNVSNVLIFIWFVPQIERLVSWIAKDKNHSAKSRLKILGDLSTISPELALEEADGELILMGQVTLDLLDTTRQAMEMKEVETTVMDRVSHLENVTDKIQKEVTVFLCEILQMPLEQDQSLRAYALIRISDEIESVGDYCERIANYCARLIRNEQKLTDEAQREMRECYERTVAYFARTLEYIKDGKEREMPALVATADSLGNLSDEIRANHLERVKSGVCDPLAGLTFSDIIVAMRRIKNHTINMADAKNNRWKDRRENTSSRHQP